VQTPPPPPPPPDKTQYIKTVPFWHGLALKSHLSNSSQFLSNCVWVGEGELFVIGDLIDSDHSCLQSLSAGCKASPADWSLF
jgi:hypothetical protein